MVQKILQIRHYLTRIFRVDLGYLLRGGSFLAISQVGSALFSFVLTFAYARYLPQEVFGTYRYVLATYGLLAIAALPGIDTAIIETVAKGNHKAFLHAVKTKFLYGFIGTLFGFGVALYHYSRGETQLAFLFLIASLFLPFIECLSLYSGFLNAQKKFGVMAAFEIVNQLLSVSVLIITIYLTDNVYALLCAYFVPYIVIKFVATLYCLKYYVANDRIDHSYLAYGKAMTGFTVITKIIASIDQMVLFHVIGPAQVAVFAIATAVPARFQSVLKIVGTLALPKYAEQQEEVILRGLIRKMAIFGIGVSLACLFYIAIAPYFFRFFFPKYLASVPYSQLAILYTLSGVTYPFGAYLSAHKKIKENFFFAIVSFSVKVACLVFLVPLFGVWGAVWGIVLSSWSIIGMTLYYIKRPSVIKSISLE